MWALGEEATAAELAVARFKLGEGCEVQNVLKMGMSNERDETSIVT